MHRGFAVAQCTHDLASRDRFSEKIRGAGRHSPSGHFNRALMCLVTRSRRGGSAGCSTSPDCTIVAENNACASTCGMPIPKAAAENLERNLNETSLCSNCPLPPQVLCERMVPACVNGKCVAAEPD